MTAPASRRPGAEIEGEAGNRFPFLLESCMFSESALAEDRLTTRRLTLSPLTPMHAPALFALLLDWDVVRMLAEVPWPLTLADVQSHAAKQAEPDPASTEFAIMAAETAIGVCGVKKPGCGDPPRLVPRLGYWIGQPFWNRGCATEAVAALVEYSFRSFPQDVIGAGVFRDNPASRRVLEKLGFEEAGIYELHCRARCPGFGSGYAP